MKASPKSALSMMTRALIAIFIAAYHPSAEAVCQSRDAEVDQAFNVNDAGGYYALVIGNNEYVELSKLKTAENDAKEIDKVLRETYGFKTKLLLNATRQDIFKNLNEYRRTLDENSNLLIYYAGHGYYDRDVKKGYWLPVDASKSDNANWVSADDVTTNVRGMNARHVLIISDSCFSGTIVREDATNLSRPESRDKYIQKLLGGKSRMLMASGGNEPVADGGEGDHSVFAGALLRGLKGMRNDIFTAGELYSGYVREAVAGKAEQTPEFDPLRVSGHDSGEFVFIRQSPTIKKLRVAQKAYDEGKRLVSVSSPAANADALKKYEEALAIYREIGDAKNEATTLKSIGDIHYYAGQMPDAVRSYDQALAKFRAAGDEDGEARTLHNLGLVYQQKEDNKKAIEFYQQSISIKERKGDRVGTARTLSVIGDLFVSLKKYEQAKTSYQKALGLFEAEQLCIDTVLMMNRLSRVYFELGDNKKGRELDAKSMALKQRCSTQHMM